MENTETRKKQGFFGRLATSYRRIPDKKPYIEFVTAILSIPVLLTVILLNLNTLTGSKDKNNKEDTKQPQTVVITAPSASNQAQPNTSTNTKQEECTPEVGPISITSPNEGDTVIDNPVFIGINYKQGDYCSAVWSYRINGGAWSDYDDQSISLYNPTPGNIRFELRVKSLVGNDSRTLTRNFIYQGTSITQTTPPPASSSAH